MVPSSVSTSVTVSHSVPSWISSPGWRRAASSEPVKARPGAPSATARKSEPWRRASASWRRAGSPPWSRRATRASMAARMASPRLVPSTSKGCWAFGSFSSSFPVSLRAVAASSMGMPLSASTTFRLIHWRRFSGVDTSPFWAAFWACWSWRRDRGRPAFSAWTCCWSWRYQSHSPAVRLWLILPMRFTRPWSAEMRSPPSGATRVSALAWVPRARRKFEKLTGRKTSTGSAFFAASMTARW